MESKETQKPGKNSGGHTPLELVKEGDQDVVDLLRGGDSALLDAAKKGNLSRVQKHVKKMSKM